MKCDSCGLEKETSKLTLDPFQLLVWQERVIRMLCNYCFERRLRQV